MRYKDKQRFKDWSVYGLLGFFNVLAAIGFVLLMTWDGGPFFARAFTCLAISLGLTFLMLYLKKLRLKVSINDKRIKYKLSPIHKHSRRIPWDEVESCKLVETPQCSRWHGSNVHFLNEVMHSFNGRNGLSITTQDGRHYFIGVKDTNYLRDKLNQIEWLSHALTNKKGPP